VLGWCRLLGRVVATERDLDRCFVETRGLGVSLGWFVFWSRGFAPGFASAAQNRAHEHGHSFQSRRYGPLYLGLVGLPSVARVVYSVACYRLTGKSWDGYYDAWPEDDADRLGGVVR
jgi:hypothetical protein